MSAFAKWIPLTERRLRRARLVSGLIIYSFLLMHMSNHVFGLMSVEAADDARPIFLFIWRNPLGTTVLYGAFLIHIGLTLRSIYVRRSFVMPKGEALQIILGLAIPVMIIDHILATRVASQLFRLSDSYETVVHLLWTKSPISGLRQAIALVIVWIHGCIGIHFWLRHRHWYPSVWPWFLTLAILLPVLSLLGFAQMGRSMTNPTFMLSGFPGGYYDPTVLPANADSQLQMIRIAVYCSFAGALLLVFVLRGIRWFGERAHLVTIHYPTGEAISVPRGYTVLEASRLAGKPHYAVCGGKGRCSTCRVQIIAGEESLPPAEPLEQKTLDRIGAGSGIRLACQLRPSASLTLAPLLVAMPERAVVAEGYESVPGREREIAVLFCDIRNFTSLSEARLPFDIVFLLNRYFAVVGHAVEASGGRIDKFIGDGAMALFGISGSAADACRQALDAAVAIASGIDELNRQLADELTTPLRIAMGIHVGPAVVGTIGYGATQSLTAIGDTVNVASRLESAAKEFDLPLVISEPVAELSQIDVSSLARRDIVIRGRSVPLKVFAFHSAGELALLQTSANKVRQPDRV
ncbi:adenylate/guanylate cyclase domain-containing protein [Rhizobium sp. 0TCS1.26]|uniref:adenylate/guanylate cyclase domain-containing protein n=1 Tax=Rhizobium sp. 0TCS1.26 TaxID=3142623 RepID=UPI003D2D9F14